MWSGLPRVHSYISFSHKAGYTCAFLGALCLPALVSGVQRTDWNDQGVRTLVQIPTPYHDGSVLKLWGVRRGMVCSDSHLRNSSQVLFWTKPLITLFFICWFIPEWRPWPTVNSTFFHPGPGHTQTFLKAQFQGNTVYLNDMLWILIVSLLFYLLFHLKMLIKTH